MEYGLDLSQHNGALIFGTIKKAGNNFVILRAGYGWSTAQKDPMFETYYQQAKAAGLKVGAYWYSYATNTELAALEARCFLEVIKGKQFDMPVYLDMEDADGWKRANGNPSGAMQAQISNVFMKIVQDAGYYVGIYSSSSWFDSYLIGLDASYTRWVANWGNDDGTNHGGVSAPMHQYTSAYTLGGKRFDRNIAYVDFAKAIKDNGLNGYPKPSIKKPEEGVRFDVLKWVEEHKNAFLDPDHVYGYQCVDVFKQLLLDMGVTDGDKALGGDGFAHQICYRFKEQGYDKHFDKLPGLDAKPGDVVVFGKGGDTPLSHVGICIKWLPGGRMEVFGQNQGGTKIEGIEGSGTSIASISTQSLLCALRAKATKPKPKPLERKPKNYVYRLYNPHGGDHLYTKDYNEAKSLTEFGWVNETGWISPESGANVYRLYDGKFHTYALKEEHDKLIQSGWRSEGIAFKSGGSKPVFRLYNPNDGSHILTIERKEHDALSYAGWYCEGQDLRGA